jgi:hypothetical protein
LVSTQDDDNGSCEWLSRSGDDQYANDKSADQQVEDYVRLEQAPVYQQLKELKESLRTCINGLHKLELNNARFWETVVTAKEVVTQHISTEVSGIMKTRSQFSQKFLQSLMVIVMTQDCAAKLTGRLGGGLVTIHVLRNCIIELGIIDEAQRSTTIAALAVLSHCRETASSSLSRRRRH